MAIKSLCFVSLVMFCPTAMSARNKLLVNGYARCCLLGSTSCHRVRDEQPLHTTHAGVQWLYQTYAPAHFSDTEFLAVYASSLTGLRDMTSVHAEGLQ